MVSAVISSNMNFITQVCYNSCRCLYHMKFESLGGHIYSGKKQFVVNSVPVIDGCALHLMTLCEGFCSEKKKQKTLIFFCT